MMPCMEKMVPLPMFAELPLSLSNALSYRSAICPCFENASSSDTWVTDIQVKNDAATAARPGSIIAMSAAWWRQPPGSTG